MPQVTVYVREEDLPVWKMIGKKSEFIHDALAQFVQTLPKPAPSSIGKSESISPSTHPSPSAARFIKTKQDVEKATEHTGYISKSFSARKKK